MIEGDGVCKKDRRRRYWVRPWLTQAEHEEESQYTRLMPRLELDDPMAYRNFIRMPPELFQELEQRFAPELQREKTLMREPLSPGLKLAVTLRSLASGDSYPTLQYAFRVARLTVNKFVPEVCVAIIRAYRDEVMTCPTSPEDSSSDAQIFKHKIEDGNIGFLGSESLVADGPRVKFFILGDDAFPLKLWLMKPYLTCGMDLNQRVFNYSFSRGRRVVENAFGILTSHFRVFQRLM